MADCVCWSWERYNLYSLFLVCTACVYMLGKMDKDKKDKDKRRSGMVSLMKNYFFLRHFIVVLQLFVSQFLCFFYSESGFCFV